MLAYVLTVSYIFFWSSSRLDTRRASGKFSFLKNVFFSSNSRRHSSSDTEEDFGVDFTVAILIYSFSNLSASLEAYLRTEVSRSF